MRRRRHLLAEVALIVAACVSLVTSCATTEAPKSTVVATTPTTDLDVNRLCDVIVDVGDATARSSLVATRHAYEIDARTDRHAAFGMMLARSTPDERFRAFHADRAAVRTSSVGVLGECLVYANWPRMGAEAAAACDAAVALVGAHSPIVQLARVDSAITHGRDDAAAAVALADAALVKAPGCTALHVARARAVATMGERSASRTAWAEAVKAAPKCFRCLVEQAALEEQLDGGPGGRATAAALWERALSLAPEHPETLRRFAAATAGVDDARALRAWEAAVKAGARDYPTLLATARLSSTLASTPAEREVAFGYARRAADAGKDDPEARRLLVEAALNKGALDDAVVAANALLELIADDVIAHAAIARVAVGRGQMVEAVQGYDAAVVSLGDTNAGVDAATATAIRAEQRGLLERLGVNESKRPNGSVTAVANQVQRALQNLWRDRIKKKGATKGGVLTVVVETAADGSVATTAVKSDAVGDAEVAAAAVAWLSRATINGGARRHTLEFTLQ